MQDMRGTQQSEGNFSMWRNDAKDLYDTMEWATKQPWSDGTVRLVAPSSATHIEMSIAALIFFK
jgi:predicted acyl esterase